MTYIAFLRAINVGGHATVKMTDVRDAFVAAGCRNVRSVIQSGNVIFDAPASGRTALETRICQRLAALIGKDPGVCVRTARELESVAEAGPFANNQPRFVASHRGRPDARTRCEDPTRRPRRIRSGRDDLWAAPP